MEVEDSSKANELLTDEELLFAEDGETTEYTSGEVEQVTNSALFYSINLKI